MAVRTQFWSCTHHCSRRSPMSASMPSPRLESRRCTREKRGQIVKIWDWCKPKIIPSRRCTREQIVKIWDWCKLKIITIAATAVAAMHETEDWANNQNMRRSPRQSPQLWLLFGSILCGRRSLSCPLRRVEISERLQCLGYFSRSSAQPLLRRPRTSQRLQSLWYNFFT